MYSEWNGNLIYLQPLSTMKKVSVSDARLNHLQFRLIQIIRDDFSIPGWITIYSWNCSCAGSPKDEFVLVCVFSMPFCFFSAMRCISLQRKVEKVQ